MPLVIPDTKRDAASHPATAASPGIACFIGVPIVLNDGTFFGTLCAVDSAPQDLKPQHTQLLVVLARILATHLEREREAVARQQAEAEQQRLYHAAQEALREREALLSIASHELKNPLAAVYGYGQMLQRRSAHLSEQDQRAVQMIVSQAQRLDRMLSDLLDVAQLERGKFVIKQEPLDLMLLIERVCTEYQPVLAQHTLVIDSCATPLIVSGDAVRLEQVLRNLLSNAIKYSPGGGTITVSVAAYEAQALIKVSDQGLGIPADNIQHLFGRFYRAASGHSLVLPGFGIGLYVVKEIVTQHGGTVTVDSTEFVGSTFTITLPLLDKQPY